LALVQAAALGLSAISNARADDPKQHSSSYRRFLIEGHAALLGSPVGVVGLMAEVAPVPFWGLAGGVGIGSAGPQFAGNMRIRINFDGLFALVLEPAISAGRYRPFAYGGRDSEFLQ
jgi:hypothetical protein